MQHRFKLFCDVETSGGCPIKNGVISACFVLVDQDLKIVDEFVRNVRPKEHTRSNWDKGAQAVHKMTFEQVESFISNEQFCYELLTWLKGYKELFPLTFVCHALDFGIYKKHPYTKKLLGGYDLIPWFDWRFMEYCFKKESFIDGSSMVYTWYKVFEPCYSGVDVVTYKAGAKSSGSYEIFKKREYLESTIKIGRMAGYKKNKLNIWAERIGFQLNHHDARSDTYCCLEVYKYLRNQYDLEDSIRDKAKTSIRQSTRLF